MRAFSCMVLRALPPGIFSNSRDNGTDLDSQVLPPNFQKERLLSFVNLKFTWPFAIGQEGGGTQWVPLCRAHFAMWLFIPGIGLGQWWVSSVSLWQVNLASTQDRLMAPSLSPTWPAPGLKDFFGWTQLWGLKENFILKRCNVSVKVFFILKMPSDDWFYFYTRHFLAKKLNK